MTDTPKFSGFPPGKTHMIKVPSQFFSELLGAIDDLAEMKVTLYCFWALQQQEGQYRYVQLGEALNDAQFMQGFDPDPARAAAQVRQGFARAVARGTLLHITLDTAAGSSDLYFMNTAQGRNAVRAIEAGDFVPGDRETPIALVVERPNIFALYEQNIGPLTPLIGDQLRDAEGEYPAAWIEEAIQLAVEHNKRNWKYIAAILKRWQTEGKDRGQSKRPTQADRYRYIEGEYSDYIET